MDLKVTNSQSSELNRSKATEPQVKAPPGVASTPTKGNALAVSLVKSSARKKCLSRPLAHRRSNKRVVESYYFFLINFFSCLSANGVLAGV